MEPKPDSSETAEETIVGPEPTGAETAPPSWLTSDKPILPTDDEPSEAPKGKDDDVGAELAISTIRIAHDKAVEVTGYEGFMLPASMEDHWRKVVRYIFKRVPMKDWPLYMAALGLMVGYGAMVLGYVKHRREVSANAPKVPPAEDR